MQNINSIASIPSISNNQEHLNSSTSIKRHQIDDGNVFLNTSKTNGHFTFRNQENKQTETNDTTNIISKTKKAQHIFEYEPDSVTKTIDTNNEVITLEKTLDNSQNPYIDESFRAEDILPEEYYASHNSFEESTRHRSWDDNYKTNTQSSVTEFSGHRDPIILNNINNDSFQIKYSIANIEKDDSISQYINSIQETTNKYSSAIIHNIGSIKSLLSYNYSEIKNLKNDYTTQYTELNKQLKKHTEKYEAESYEMKYDIKELRSEYKELAQKIENVNVKLIDNTNEDKILDKLIDKLVQNHTVILDNYETLFNQVNKHSEVINECFKNYSTNKKLIRKIKIDIQKLNNNQTNTLENNMNQYHNDQNVVNKTNDYHQLESNDKNPSSVEQNIIEVSDVITNKFNKMNTVKVSTAQNPKYLKTIQKIEKLNDGVDPNHPKTVYYEALYSTLSNALHSYNDIGDKHIKHNDVDYNYLSKLDNLFKHCQGIGSNNSVSSKSKKIASIFKAKKYTEEDINELAQSVASKVTLQRFEEINNIYKGELYFGSDDVFSAEMSDITNVLINQQNYPVVKKAIQDSSYILENLYLNAGRIVKNGTINLDDHMTNYALVTDKMLKNHDFTDLNKIYKSPGIFSMVGACLGLCSKTTNPYLKEFIKIAKPYATLLDNQISSIVEDICTKGLKEGLTNFDVNKAINELKTKGVEITEGHLIDMIQKYENFSTHNNLDYNPYIKEHQLTENENRNSEKNLNPIMEDYDPNLNYSDNFNRPYIINQDGLINKKYDVNASEENKKYINEVHKYIEVLSDAQIDDEILNIDQVPKMYGSIEMVNMDKITIGEHYRSLPLDFNTNDATCA